MRQTLTAAVVVLALAGLASCVRDQAGPPNPEVVTINVRMDPATKECRLEQRKPGELRTASGRSVEWRFVGACPGGEMLAIRPALMKDGQLYEYFDLDSPDTTLTGRVPENVAGRVVLTARMKDNVEPGDYTYQILMGEKPAHYNPEADEGDFRVCPTWPCDGFSQ